MSELIYAMLVEAGGFGGVMVLLALLARRMRALPRRVLPWLWTAAALRMLLPIGIRSPLSVYGLFAPSPSAGTTNIITLNESAVTVSESASPFAACALLWAAGSAACALALLWAHGHSARRLRFALPLRDVSFPPEAACRARLYTCEGLCTPLSCGIFRPRVILPAFMNLRDETLLRHVLLHEAAHVRGHHNLLKLLALAAACLHWMNPLAWVLVWALGRDLELSCDETVLRTLGGGARKGYARSLLCLAERARVSAPLAAGFGRTAVRSRIERVAKYRRCGAPGLIAGAALVALSALCLSAPPPPLGVMRSASSGTVWSVTTQDEAFSQKSAEYSVSVLSDAAPSTVVVTMTPNGISHNMEGTAAWAQGEPAAAESVDVVEGESTETAAVQIGTAQMEHSK